ncbi:hypothetical protein CL622_03380 [archaeon]|nr:hypothetical protein [archaeon]|tara:strand:+ start:557 stop:958 length:402 start_codon:yes stop_codon:yes gene_type:complete
MPRKAGRKKTSPKKQAKKTTRTKATKKTVRAMKAPRASKTIRLVSKGGSVRPSGYAVTSLVAAGLGYLPIGVLLKIVFEVAAVVVGFIALSKIKKHPNIAGRYIAMAGIILSIVWLVLYILFSVAYSAVGAGY